MPGLGFGYGFSTVIWIIAIIIVAGVIWRGRTRYVSGTTIVLTKFHINEDPSAGPALEIAGRVSGVISWILTLLRLSPEVEFVVTDTEVIKRTASLSGIEHIYVPLAKVTASVCGYQRSILAFGFALLFTLGFVLNLLSGFVGSNRNEASSDMGLAFGYLVLAAIAALVYFLSKRIAIVVESMHSHGVVFKQSVIGNVPVDLAQALEAISVVNARILAAQTVKTFVVDHATAPQPSRMAAAAPLPSHCPKCSAENPIGTRFCENCGSALGG
jgi:hypothetical protein